MSHITADEALGKLLEYSKDFGDWLLTASTIEVHKRAREIYEKVQVTAPGIERNKLMAQYTQLQACVYYIEIADTRRHELAPKPAPVEPLPNQVIDLAVALNPFQEAEDAMDPQQFDEDRTIAELGNIVTSFGDDVIYMSAQELRMLALDHLTKASVGTLLCSLDELKDAVKMNYIARVRQRAEDLQIDIEDHVFPGYLSLRELKADEYRPKYPEGTMVYQTLKMAIGDDKHFECVSESVVIGTSKQFDVIRYRLGTLSPDGDTVIPMDGFVDEDELTDVKPVANNPELTSARRRAPFLSVVG